MNKCKILGTAIATLALAATPLVPTAFAASSITKGLKSLSLQGVGQGSLATSVSSCGGVVCAEVGNCDCLAASDTLVGNQGFGNGTLAFSILIDLSDTALLTGNFGNCNAATGTALLANQKSSNSVSMDISGLVCNTKDGLDVFNGTYVVTGGSGKYSSASGGTGTINGSHNPASAAVGNSQVTVTGSLQQTAP